MLSVLIIFILTFAIYFVLSKNVNLLESLAVTVVITLGGIGFSTFIFREYLNINYGDSNVYIIIFQSILVASILIIQYLKGERLKLINFVKLSKVDVCFLIILITLILRGFVMPVRGWDAYSLYDSRGRAFADGLTQADLEKFTKYDDTNFLYYFSYPPMTSSIHAVLYKSGFVTPMFIYPMFYSSIIIFIYSTIKKLKISGWVGITILLTVVFNKLLLEQIYSSYTNLPMIAFQICFVFLVIKYFDEKRVVNLIFGALSLGFSNWTRNLEPTFVAFLVLSIFPILYNKSNTLIKNIWIFVTILIISFSPKLLWGNYIAHSVKYLGGITPSLNELMIKLLNSLEMANLINVVFFMYQSLLPIITYVIIIVGAGLVAFKIGKNSINKEILFSLLGTALMIFLIMLTGTLYFSMTFIWWKDIPGSFLRSNLVLVPLSAIVVAYAVKGVDKK